MQTKSLFFVQKRNKMVAILTTIQNPITFGIQAPLYTIDKIKP